MKNVCKRLKAMKGYSIAEVTVVLIIMAGILLLVGRIAFGDRQKEYDAKFNKISSLLSANISKDLVENTGAEYADYAMTIKEGGKDGNEYFQEAITNNLDKKDCSGNSCWGAASVKDTNGDEKYNVNNDNWSFYELNDKTVMAVSKETKKENGHDYYKNDILVDANGAKGPNILGKDIKVYNYPFKTCNHLGNEPNDGIYTYGKDVNICDWVPTGCVADDKLPADHKEVVYNPDGVSHSPIEGRLIEQINIDNATLTNGCKKTTTYNYSCLLNTNNTTYKDIANANTTQTPTVANDCEYKYECKINDSNTTYASVKDFVNNEKYIVSQNPLDAAQNACEYTYDCNTNYTESSVESMFDEETTEKVSSTRNDENAGEITPELGKPEITISTCGCGYTYKFKCKNENHVFKFDTDKGGYYCACASYTEPANDGTIESWTNNDQTCQKDPVCPTSGNRKGNPVKGTDGKWSCPCTNSHDESDSNVTWNHNNTCDWTPTCIVPAPGDGVLVSPITTEAFKENDKWSCRCKNYGQLYIAWKETRDAIETEIHGYDTNNSRSLKSIIELRWGPDIANKLDQDRSYSSNSSKAYLPTLCGGVDTETKDNVNFGNIKCTTAETNSIINNGIPPEDVQAYVLAYDGNTVTTIGYLPRLENDGYGKLGRTSRISTDIAWSEEKAQYVDEVRKAYINGNYDSMTVAQKHKYFYSRDLIDDEFTGTVTIDGCTYNAYAYYRQQTPLVLDLKGDGFKFTSVADGVDFDIDAEGTTDRTGWTTKKDDFDDAFLVLDKNGDGQVNDGSELFGDQNGEENGYKELAKYDNNKDGKIDKNDPIYSQLRLWADMNGDGKVDHPQEWKTLEEMGIKEISTSYTQKFDENGNAKTDEHGNDVSLAGSFKRMVEEVVDGVKTLVEKTLDMVDVFFNYVSDIFGFGGGE